MANDLSGFIMPFILGAILVASATFLLPKTKKLVVAMDRAPPTAPDGVSNSEVADVKKTSLLHDLTHLGSQGTSTVLQAIKTIASGEPMDDKKLLLENAVEMLQKLPANSGLGAKAAGGFIKMLWEDLPHPPGTLAAPEEKYRRHDGGGNSPWAPEMGKAGSPYSRSVPALKTKGHNLPDPELVFDALLKRKGPFRKHPSGLNRMFFSFATVVIHECFQTNREDQSINDTSSYVDLSTLYGNNAEGQARVRTKKNGLIWPDVIASERIMLMPTGVVAVLILFSRNHNVIAQNLLSINEKGKYGDWDKLDKKQQAWQDNDIFQLARNINVGFFASVVMKDYVAAILNTPRADSVWSLDLGGEIKSGAARVERGTGNVVSVEFAVLYHWHASLSNADAVWMEDLLKWNLKEKFTTVDEVTTEMFHEVLKKEVVKKLTTEAKTWTFDHYKRGPDGRFSDADLGKIIKDCVEEPAHAFGAHGTPASLRYVDVIGQKQAREVFNVCTLNEFRKYLNLKPYESFEEWCEDKDTARAAELLYSHIDNMELYPGLQAECTKPARPGSGVCPGQTTGRGILDDAVSLVRGDRFLTYDFNSTTLTNWGFAKLGHVPGGSYGGVLPHLLFNALPGEFSGTSSYALLPFYTPEAARDIFRGNKVLDKYDTNRPADDTPIVAIHTQEGCKKILEDRDTFRTMYQSQIRHTTDGHDFLIGWDDQRRHDERSNILHKIFFENHFEANVTRYFRETTQQLIKKASLQYRGAKRSIDIVRDVCNIVPVMWIAERFAIPLKTAEHPRGLVTLHELFNSWIAIFMYQNFNILPMSEWELREAATNAAPLLRKIFEGHLKSQKGLQEGVVDWLAKGSAFEVKADADRLYHALNDSKLPMGDVISDMMGIGAPVVGNLTHQASLLIDFFLKEEHKQYKDRIVELANRNDEAADRELQGFVYEGMRHVSVVPGLPRMAAKDVTIQDGSRGPVKIKAYQTVLAATSNANMDPAAIPEPQTLDPTRPRSSYTLLGHGLHSCFGAQLIGPALASILKEVFRLKNVRRAPTTAGQFVSVSHVVSGVTLKKYIDGNAKESPVPTTLTLLYEE